MFYSVFVKSEISNHIAKIADTFTGVLLLSQQLRTIFTFVRAGIIVASSFEAKHRPSNSFNNFTQIWT